MYLKNNKQIARNTLLLYIRMLFTMLVNLYTSRVILRALGVEDFGIYNIVGSLVGTFSIISNSLSNCIGRFIAFELGRDDFARLKKVFSISISIYILLSLITLVAAEIIGVWFLNYKMNISEDRITAANWTLQFSLFTFVINLMSIPYNAAIVAHEKMEAFAYISVIEVVFKLLIVYLLLISPIDRLVFYSLLLFFLALFIRFLYGFYCQKHFKECKYKFIWDKTIFKEILGMASWNSLSSVADVFKSQGVAILINLFFGTVVNAAQGIAQQVTNAINQFSSNFMTAIVPQITKSYAAHDFSRVNNLALTGSRISFYLVLIPALPILFKTHFILKLWLGIVPEYTVVFIQCAIIQVAFEVLSRTLINIILASGYVRKYQIGVSILLFSNFPLSYLFLKLGYGAVCIYIIGILVTICTLIWRLYITYTLMKFDLVSYIKSAYLYPFFIAGICTIPYIIILHNVQETLGRVICIILIGIITTSLIVYLVGLKVKEREIINNLIRKILIKHKF